jgi:hypothetical protein
LVPPYWHVLPLTLLLVGLTWLFPKSGFDRLILPAIFITALVRPIYQTVLGSPMEYLEYPLWVTGVVALHVFLISLCQLLLFRCYDFLTMYAFRFVYYLIWHVLWGYARLRLLF